MAGESNAYGYRKFAPLDLTSNDFDEAVRAGNMKLISEYEWLIRYSKLRINQHLPVPCRGSDQASDAIILWKLIPSYN